VANLMEFASRHRTIFLFCVWTASISLIVIETFWLFVTRPARAGMFWCGGAPMFGELELFLLLIVSAVIGMLLFEPKPLIVCYVGSIFLSFAIGVTYIFLYNWSLFGRILASIPFGWEYGCFAAILNVFRILFPFGVGVCLLGAILGSTLRESLNL